MKKKDGSLRLLVVSNIREIVFGLEDSLVSTLGALTGIAAGTQNAYIVILSGLVIVVVEALSMSAGSYLSSKSADEAEDALLAEEGGRPDKFRVELRKHPIRAGVVMGVFYILGGCVPLAPYFLMSLQDALPVSVVLTAVTLFGLGAWSAQFTKRSPGRSGVEMMIVSLTAAFLGYVVGYIVQLAFGVSVAA